MVSVSDAEKFLKSLRGFQKPKVVLEQYATDAHLASRMMVMLEPEFDALCDKIIVDLGCGTGSLSIAASFFDPLLVFSVDVDVDALEIFQDNLRGIQTSYNENSMIEMILGDALCFPNFFRLSVDSVIINPPFGTKNNAGIDVKFVKSGLVVSDQVFSFHKSSTREFLEKNLHGKAIVSMMFEVSNQFSFHRKKSVMIEVDLFYFKNR